MAADKPEQIVGSYALGNPGEPVELARGRLDVGSEQADGRIYMTLDGEVDIRWEAQLRRSIDLGDVPLGVTRPDLGPVSIRAQVQSSQGSGYVTSADLASTADPTRVVVHWVNLPRILPAESLQSDNEVWPRRWRCDAAGWQMTIDARPDLDEILAAVGSTRKFAITHVGEFRRTDGGPFDASDASDVLFGLQVALSFALGRWVAPALPVGYDAKGARVWEQWASWRCDSFAGFRSWWDTYTGDDLRDFVSRFIAAWIDPAEKEVVRLFAMHVIAANHSGTTVEARIMLAQAAMEYLSWVNWVLSGRMSRRKYKAKFGDAATVVRALLDRAGIPLDVPAAATTLHGYAKRKNLDAADALTWMRNRLVHPKDAGEPYRIEGLLYEAWGLLMQYTELLLLNRLGYAGSYIPRFPPHRFARDHEPVPWT